MHRLAHADDDHDDLVLLERLVRMEVKAAINAKKIAADGLDAVRRQRSRNDSGIVRRSALAASRLMY
jgi:hypothetical protein